LSNIGALFAFIIVSVGVVVLRRTHSERVRAFRVPLSPVVPAISVLSCLGLMLGLPLETWSRVFLWG